MIWRKRETEKYEDVIPRVIIYSYDVSVHLKDGMVIEGIMKSDSDIVATNMIETRSLCNIESKDGKSRYWIPYDNIAYIEKTERHGVPVR